MFWRWELRLERRGILLGPRLLGKQMFADQLPGSCLGLGQREVTHSRQMADGLMDTWCSDLAVSSQWHRLR